jgi:hypothetical protein
VVVNGRAFFFREQYQVDLDATVSQAIRDNLQRGSRASQRTAADRLSRDLGLGGGYVTLCPGRLLAPKELAALRAVGKVGLSPTAPLILAQTSQAEVAVLGWATDALVLPDNRINCVLYSLAALLATSWSTLAPPGEPLLQHAPKLVKYKDVIGMVSRARQRSYPLERCRCRDVASPRGSGWRRHGRAPSCSSGCCCVAAASIATRLGSMRAPRCCTLALRWWCWMRATASILRCSKLELSTSSAYSLRQAPHAVSS